MKRGFFALVLATFLTASFSLNAQEDEASNALNTALSPVVIKQINVAYTQRVKPILQKKCTQCHVRDARKSWIGNLPGMTFILAYDTKKGVDSLDLTDDFPFASQQTPLEGLLLIGESIEERSMPPLRYQVANWKTFMSPSERKIILQWVKESLSHYPWGERIRVKEALEKK